MCRGMRLLISYSKAFYTLNRTCLNPLLSGVAIHFSSGGGIIYIYGSIPQTITFHQFRLIVPHFTRWEWVAFNSQIYEIIGR